MLKNEGLHGNWGTFGAGVVVDPVGDVVGGWLVVEPVVVDCVVVDVDDVDDSVFVVSVAFVVGCGVVVFGVLVPENY